MRVFERGVVLIGLLAVMGAVSAAQPEKAPVKVDIAAQPIGDALNDFAQQSGLQVVIDPKEGGSIKGPRVVGVYTPDVALAKLLANTGLRYEYLNERTLAVRIAKAEGEEGLKKSSDARKEDERPLGVAPVQGGSGQETEANEQSRSNSSASAGTDKSSVKLEEIVVTAQRRKETLQNVPIAITVFSGEELDASTGAGLVDVLQAAPGFDSSRGLYEGGTVQYVVRGVSSAAAFNGGSGPVAFYLDGVPYGFIRTSVYPDPNVYDLSQVEVLSGPQGTLYGAGSLNGVIRVLTHDANADQFELKMRASTSAVEDGGENYAGDIAVNLPIVEGVLGVRATIGVRNDSGWIDTIEDPANVYPDRPPPRSNVNDDEARSYRLKVHAQPNPSLGIDLTAWRFKDIVGGPDWSAPDRTTIAQQDQTQRQEFTTYSARIVKEFNGFSLTSTTSHIDFLNGGPLSGEAIPVPVVLDTTWTSKVFSQEFNLLSDDDGAWRWSAGAFYRDAKETRYTLFHWLIPLPDFDNNDYGDTSESYAVFGEVAHDLTDDLELAVGLRYFHDSQTTTLFKDYTGQAGTLPAGTAFDASFKATTPRIVLTWTPTENHSLYASYAQGFRSGFSQEPNVLVHAPQFEPVEPDRLTNYEIGAKGSLMHSRLSYEAALFYIDWQDVQQVTAVTIPPGSIAATAVLNIPGASGVGASFGLRARPIDGFELSGSVSWNDLTADAEFNAGGDVVHAGERLNFSPEYTINADIQYEWALGGDYLGRVSLAGMYRSPQTTRQLGGTTANSDKIYAADVAFTLETPFNWSAKLFADNVTDKNGSTAPGLFPSWSPRQHPRVFGVQVAYQFK